MIALVIGYGSIGSRHAKILCELGVHTSVVSGRKINYEPSYNTLEKAILSEKPDYVIIANKTSDHYTTLMQLVELQFKGIVLVEKPLFDRRYDIPKNSFKKILVGYDLRFHPLLRKLRETLHSERIHAIHSYFGHYLPEWRPQRDYRLSYSSKKNEGGGVLRDFSHELDYLSWILGKWISLTAVGGCFSSLEIDCDDVYSLILKTHRCPVVTVQLNALDRVRRRETLVVADKHTYKIDLVSGTFQIDDNIQKGFKRERDYTFRAEHKAILNNQFEAFCSIDEGLEITSMIQAAEKAAQSNQPQWVDNI